MIYSLLAHLVVLSHLLFVAFVVAGGFWAVRSPGVARLHLPAAAWGVAIEFFGWVCPLTYLENELRARAGEAGYDEGFLEHYLLALLYPDGLTREAQWVIGAAVLGLNLWIYSRLIRRYGRAGRHSAV